MKIPHKMPHDMSKHMPKMPHDMSKHMPKMPPGGMPKPPGGMPPGGMPKHFENGGHPHGDFKFPKMDPNMANPFGGKGPGGPIHHMNKPSET